MNALDGRIAPVTGSSRGIGAAIAAEFARRGAAVAAAFLASDDAGGAVLVGEGDRS